MCWVSRALPSGRASKRHSTDMSARSNAIPRMYDVIGLTSRTYQLRGSCPGMWVVPRDPAANGPSSSNVAGGSSQFATFVMYVQAKNNSLVALDAATGRELWVHPFEGPVVTRGINYWENRTRTERRLLTINAGFLTAIDTRTGETVLSFGDKGRVDLRIGLDRDLTYIPPIQTNNPGRIFEDIMIVPLMRSGADYGYVPGDIHAYDVRTGKLLWQFHTVPRPGEAGYETWPKDFWLRSGGGINWNELTIDEKRGIAYIPTGTAKFDHYGADRWGQGVNHRRPGHVRRAAVGHNDGVGRRRARRYRRRAIGLRH